MLARVGRLDLMHRIVQLHSTPRVHPRFDWSSEWFFATKEECKFGNASVVKWLVEHPIGLRVAEAYQHHHSAGPEHFFCLAAEGGHIEAMEYLHEQGYSDNFKDAAVVAVRNNHLDTLKWLLETHDYYTYGFMVEEAARHGHINILQFFHRTISSEEPANGHLKVVKWLYANRTEGCTVKAFKKAMQNSHLCVAWWLHARFPKWNPSIDTLQIQSPNQFDILLFLDEHFPNIYDIQDYDQPILAVVTEPDDRHAMTWMREKHNINIDGRDP
ncbi:hypothetical protein Pcac1_g16871 [Phytophthora cactorum]|nr:hypothetical protein Pcac1_g16871 [Phytophthora cactorum]